MRVNVAEQRAQFKKERVACKMRPREGQWKNTPTMALLRLGITVEARLVHVLRHGLYEREQYLPAPQGASQFNQISAMRYSLATLSKVSSSPAPAPAEQPRLILRIAVRGRTGCRISQLTSRPRGKVANSNHEQESTRRRVSNSCERSLAITPSSSRLKNCRPARTGRWLVLGTRNTFVEGRNAIRRFLYFYS
jgi:hypothetical protein